DPIPDFFNSSHLGKVKPGAHLWLSGLPPSSNEHRFHISHRGRLHSWIKCLIKQDSERIAAGPTVELERRGTRSAQRVCIGSREDVVVAAARYLLRNMLPGL